VVGALSLNRNTRILDGNFLGQNDVKRPSHRDGQGNRIGVWEAIRNPIRPNVATEEAQAYFNSSRPFDPARTL